MVSNLNRTIKGVSYFLDVGNPEEVDLSDCQDLWRRVGSMITATPVRDGAYLCWRYDTSENGPYRLATVREGSRLAGVAVVRRPRAKGDPRLSGIRVATLSELIFQPNRRDVGLATIAAAEQIARHLESDALLCSASHHSVAALLRRRAFLRLPGNVHVLTRNSLGDNKLPPELEEWWLTRGDSNADDLF